MTMTQTRDMLTVASELAAELEGRAREGEQLGTLPADLAGRAKALGLFKLGLPASLGGLELEPQEIVRTVEELCRADGSAGWSITIGNSTAFLAWLEPSVANDLLDGNSDVAIASQFGPTGRLTPSGSGYTLDGKWPFGSGSCHSEWFFNGAFVFDGDKPRMVPDRGPDWRLALIPRSAVEIAENWDVIGLQGTGSHDISVSGYAIDRSRTAGVFFEPALHDGPLYRLPFFTLCGVLFAGIPLGIARRALDEFLLIAPAKTRVASTTTMANEDDVQIALAHVDARLRAARAFVFEALQDIWDSACRGDVPHIDQRARFQLANQEAMRAAISAIDTVFTLTGAGAVHLDHPLQRCFRDIHTACQHIYWAPAADKRYARTVFGIEQPTFLM